MEPLIAEIKMLADQMISRIDSNGNKLIEPIDGEGGATTAYEYAYYMADMPLLTGAHRIPIPAPDAEKIINPYAEKNTPPENVREVYWFILNPNYYGTL